MNDTTKATPSNQSSEKLLTVMEALSYEDTPVRLQDLSKKLSMNASTVLRFLSTLQSKGYVQQESGNGRYFLTYKICSMANRVIAHTSIRNISAPYLKTISQIFGETANLSVEQNMLVVYILRSQMDRIRCLLHFSGLEMWRQCTVQE